MHVWVPWFNLKLLFTKCDKIWHLLVTLWSNQCLVIRPGPQCLLQHRHAFCPSWWTLLRTWGVRNKAEVACKRTADTKHVTTRVTHWWKVSRSWYGVCSFTYIQDKHYRVKKSHSPLGAPNMEQKVSFYSYKIYNTKSNPWKGTW